MIPEILTKKPTANGVISFVTGLLILLIAIGSFALSYNNLHQTALSHGVGPSLAYIWPLLIDFALVVFSLAVVQSNLNNEPAYRRWLMVALYTIATIAFNVYHAPANLAAQIVAVVAPVTLFLSFETLMAMLKNGVIKRGVVLSLSDLAQQLAQKKAELTDFEARRRAELANLEAEYSQRASQLQEEIEAKAKALESYNRDIEAKKEELKKLTGGPTKIILPANLSLEQKQDMANQMANDGLTNEQVATALGVSLATVKNYKRATREANGNGKKG